MPRKYFNLHRWHRYLGLTILLFVILLSITGILLNHTEDLQLAKRYVHSEWILKWYGIQTPTIDVAFPLESETKQRWLSAIDEKLYLNQQLLLEHFEGNLLGAVETSEQLIVVLISEQLLLFTLEGELIEGLTPIQGLPSGINALGLNNKKQIVVRTATGIYQPDIEFLFWKKISGDNVKQIKIQWILPQSPPKRLQQQLSMQMSILPWERLLLDLHSGRLLGNWGVYIMDAVAILLLILAPTGFFIWLRQWYRRRRANAIKLSQT